MDLGTKLLNITGKKPITVIFISWKNVLFNDIAKHYIETYSSLTTNTLAQPGQSWLGSSFSQTLYTDNKIPATLPFGRCVFLSTYRDVIRILNESSIWRFKKYIRVLIKTTFTSCWKWFYFYFFMTRRKTGFMSALGYHLGLIKL